MYSPFAQLTCVPIKPIPLTPISFANQRVAFAPASELMLASSGVTSAKIPVDAGI